MCRHINFCSTKFLKNRSSHLCCLVLLEGIDIEWILQNENRPTEYGNEDCINTLSFDLFQNSKTSSVTAQSIFLSGGTIASPYYTCTCGVLVVHAGVVRSASKG